jgi:hypothetical protein
VVSENCETTIKNFINKDLGVEGDVEFQNVHRLRQMFDRKPRNIIAKFTKYTDHEKVRTAAFEKHQAIFHRVGLHFKKFFLKFYVFPLELVLVRLYGRHPSFHNIIVKFLVGNSL